MFAQYAFTCNFWGNWVATAKQLSRLPTNVLSARIGYGKRAVRSERNTYEQRLGIQQELLRHRLKFAPFWRRWWLARAWEGAEEEATRSESGARAQRPAHGLTEKAQPSAHRQAGRRGGRGKEEECVPSSSARCECGEIGCGTWPACIKALADLAEMADLADLADALALQSDRHPQAQRAGRSATAEEAAVHTMHTGWAGHDGHGVLTPLLSPQMAEHCRHHELTPITADVTDDGKRRRTP